jgi:hypothetical protein
LSDEFYGIIIGRFEAGQAAATISKQMKLPDSTVRDAIQRWKKFGTAVPAKRTGRPEKLNKKKKKPPSFEPSLCFLPHRVVCHLVQEQASDKAVWLLACPKS